MRILALALPFAACTEAAPVPLTYRSTLETATRGLVLHDGGDRGHAGMWDTNCPFETARALRTGDYDLEGGGEKVEDAGATTLGPETVVMTLNGRVHLIDKHTGEYVYEEVDWHNVSTARLWNDGLVGLVHTPSGCSVEWLVDGQPTAVAVACDAGGFDVTPDGRVILGGSLTEIVTIDGTHTEVDAGRLVAADDALDLFYVADAGSRFVSAVDHNAATLWTTEVPGAVVALASAGAQGAAVVSVTHADGSASLLWLDGWTGELKGEVATPTAAPAIRSSPNGERIALVLQDETHFYEVGLP